MSFLWESIKDKMDFQEWMETKGMAIMAVIGYPIVFPLMNIIKLSVYKKHMSFEEYDQITKDLWEDRNESK